MLKRSIAVSVLAGAFAISAGPLLAADQDRDRMQEQAQDQERIYGSQLMTLEERNEYRAQMRAAKTAEERERIRNEHHEQMQQRAMERGMMLPDMPPEAGGGMGPGGGMRQGGMGPGGGMGGGGMRQGGGR